MGDGNSTTTGSIRGYVCDGIPFDVPADCNITFKFSKYKREGIPTSGKTMQKMTKQVQTVEGLEISTTPSEAITLKEKSEGLASVTHSIQIADGSIFKSKGTIDFEGYESETGKSKVNLIPDGDWTPFLA